MELTQDWRGFQNTFYPAGAASASRALFVVTDSGLVLAAYAEGADESQWVGARTEEVRAGNAARPVVEIDRADAEKWVEAGLALSHIQEQIEKLRSAANLSPAARRARHFLLEAVQGWWAKILPSSYGIFLRAGEGARERDFLIVIRRGKLDAFYEPDLSSMGAERRKQPMDVVRYLSERHSVAVQGIFVPETDWQRWSASENPWREVAQAVRANRARLVPFRWAPAFLVATRAFLKV
jgi:hypothetical protein